MTAAADPPIVEKGATKKRCRSGTVSDINRRAIPLPVDLGGWEATLEPDPGIGRLTGMNVPWPVSSMVAAALAVLVGACAGSPAASDLPRTTGQGITITVSVSEEVLPLTGCRTQWLMSHDEEPPPGACEQTMTVRRFIGQHEEESVETWWWVNRILIRCMPWDWQRGI